MFRAFLDRFLRRSSAPSRDAEVQRCVEDPDGAREDLARSQREVADALEDAFQALDRRSQKLAGEIGQLSDGAIRAEWGRLKAEQQALRHALHRFQASQRQAEELSSELHAWASRAEEGMADADEARRRAEIARSELAWRGQAAPELETRRPKEGVRLERPTGFDVPMRTERVALQIHGVDPELIPDEAHLLQTIRDAVREVEKWHGHAPESHGVDAVSQVRHLRDLHAILKRLDRGRGIRRDRIHLAPRLVFH
jgi:hypothetical protein